MNQRSYSMFAFRMRSFWKSGPLPFAILLLGVVLLPIHGKAHEPIYGLGPETLAKNLHAIELGATFRKARLEYELAYGYGITQNWTLRLDVPTIQQGKSFGLGNVKLRSKYALWRGMKKGVLQRLTSIAVISLPTANKKLGLAPNAIGATLGLAYGYESRRWYAFADVGYTLIKSYSALQAGNTFNYNVVGGIRPIKSEYLKPDLVLLVELNGEWSERSRKNGNEITTTGGSTLAVAPGFLFSYRNIMLKGGVQFGIAKTKNATMPATNGLVSLEYHF